jgi:hypothetical protein
VIHLAHRITRGDLAAAPGRSAAIAVLLVAAAWLPTATDTDLGYGLVLASVVSFCAVLGALALDEARYRLLEQNGARRSATGLVAAASIVPPAAAATVVALGLGLVLSPSPATLEVVLATLLVPVVTAPIAVWVSRRASADAAGGAPAGWLHRVGRTTSGALFVLVALAMPALGITLVALKLTAGSWSTSRLRRALGALLAVAVIAAAVEMVGNSSTWWDLGLALLWTGAGLAVAVVVLGIHAVSLGAGAASHVGPRARLALAPLVGRRRSLAPLVGVISFVAALSVSEAVVGASFGQREADRERDIPTVTAEAGNRSDQAIAVVPPVDVAALRAVAAEQVAGTGAAAVVVEQVGFVPPPSMEGMFGLLRIPEFDQGVFLVPIPAPGEPAGDAPPSGGWIGVVAPEDLAAMGWASASPAMDAGEVVLTSGAPGQPATVVLSSFGEIEERPAVAVDGPTGGALLPTAIVSDSTAAALTPVRTAARVVVVPAPGASVAPSTDVLVEIAGRIRSAVAWLPIVEPTGLSPEQQSAFQLVEAFAQSGSGTSDVVVAGDDSIVLRESGPLNDVPGFATTADEGRGRLVGLAALAVLMTVAGVLLALGAARSDDVVLEVQGAPTGMRSAVSAIQAAAVATSAAAFAAVAGIGIPALAFRIYNQDAELPDIPLVVPTAVWAVLVAIPVLAVAISAAIPAARRPAGPDQLAALGNA